MYKVLLYHIIFKIILIYLKELQVFTIVSRTKQTTLNSLSVQVSFKYYKVIGKIYRHIL